MASRNSPSCRLFGILAHAAPVAVLLRRGPTDWVELIRWDLEGDRFERGQWFHGRIYERRSDLSPDGSLFVYFASKGGGGPRPGSDFPGTWTALSRPPYFTALTLWPKGDSWDGGGRFDVNRRRDAKPHLFLNHAGESPTHPHHPAPKSLRVTPNQGGRGEDLPIYNDILQGKGWRHEETGERRGELRAVQGPHVWTKPAPGGGLVLRMELERIDFTQPGGPLHFGFALLRAADGELVDVLDAQWADWDGAGRLVYASGGRLFAARVEGESLQPVQLADFTDDQHTPVVAPDWATRW